MVNAPWYVRKAGLHGDLKMEMFTAEIRRFARKHEARPSRQSRSDPAARQ